ncbi:MAG: helix-turn-helix domain-containing protein [Xanthomonadaceae bacterium]|nr:helix-turn-helix domain-containing protein [Xanthomonadaceae bacterium]
MNDKNTNTRGEQNINKNDETRTGSGSKSRVDSKSEVLFFESFLGESGVSQNQVRWLTTVEAARYLRVSVSSLKTMIYRGKVRAHKLGRLNRFLRDELERLITLPIKQ